MASATCQRRLRRELRSKRKALGARAQARHARQVAIRLSRLPLTRRAYRVALYVAADGELDPMPLRARLGNRRWYLPVIQSLDPPSMAFYPDPHPEYRRRNGFGILEPHCTRYRPTRLASLDLVLVPLVGFDSRCRRIGMGLGFYDRYLGPLREHRHWRRPRLIGLAHECQRVAALTTNPWDIPLDAVVTEKTIYRCGQPRLVNDRTPVQTR